MVVFLPRSHSKRLERELPANPVPHHVTRERDRERDSESHHNSETDMDLKGEGGKSSRSAHDADDREVGSHRRVAASTGTGTRGRRTSRSGHSRGEVIRSRGELGRVGIVDDVLADAASKRGNLCENTVEFSTCIAKESGLSYVVVAGKWGLTVLLVRSTSAGEDDAGANGVDKLGGLGAETCEVRSVAANALGGGVQAAQGALGELADHAGKVAGRGSCSRSSGGGALGGGRGNQDSGGGKGGYDLHVGQLLFLGLLFVGLSITWVN